MAELAFERVDIALEATRGTAVTPPTHNLNLTGRITPMKSIYRPSDNLGVLAEFGSDEIVRKWGEFAFEGPLDVKKAPILMNMVLAAVTAPTTPTNGVLTRLWTFVRAMTTDTIKSATLYDGDVVQKMYQAAFAMADEFSWEADATGEDGATMSISGHTAFPDDLAANPTLPTVSAGPLLVPGRMQMWLDTATIGTTAITGRLLSAGGTIPTGVTYKFPATGPAGSITYTNIGRVKTHPELRVTLDMVDQAQWATYEAGSVVKMRVRVNGSLIESVTPDYYYYFEQDIYGRMSDLAWGDYEGSNRTLEFTVQGLYDTTAATDTVVRIQNTNTVL